MLCIHNVYLRSKQKNPQKGYLACEALKKLEKQTKNDYGVRKKGTQNLIYITKVLAKNVETHTNVI